MNAAAEPNSAPAMPPSRREQSYYVVLIPGAITSALALLGVYLLENSSNDFNIMGWYANYVLPVGAMLVGLVASSGYGVASWFSGVKITRMLLGAVLVFQLVVYFAAQHIEFSHLQLAHRDGRPCRFFRVLRFGGAFALHWRGDNGQLGQPLGVWGYAFRLLEIVGFVGGSLIVPAVLLKHPYCQACQRYMRSKQLSLLAASVPAKKVKKADTAGTAAHLAEQEQALARGQRLCEILQQMSAAGQAAEFRQTLAELEPAEETGRQASDSHQSASYHLQEVPVRLAAIQAP